MASVLQEWVMELPLMMQGVLLTSMRGPDGAAKSHRSKPIVHALRRMVLLSGVDGRVLTLDEPGAGTFAPPVTDLASAMDLFVATVDELPHHFIMHVIHSAEIIGYHYHDENLARQWLAFYEKCCADMHMAPETKREMDVRLRDRWVRGSRTEG